MKVQIIGVGIVGSTIANNLILGAYDVDTLILCDVEDRRLLGEFRDLNDARKLAGRDIEIRPVTMPEYIADFHIICVGERVYNISMNELMPDNFPLVLEIVRRIKGGIIIVTNPADTITEILKEQGYNVIEAGAGLDKVREGMGYTGRDIRLCKGHTNFGIASEVLGMIKGISLKSPV